VSAANGWLASRRPTPPPDLSNALRVERTAAPVSRALLEVGLDRLDSARAQLGRVRESAFRLLEADALLTYACEAALESEDPRAELRRILLAVGS
jgi:hypothetical protein